MLNIQSPLMYKVLSPAGLCGISSCFTMNKTFILKNGVVGGSHELRNQYPDT